MQCKARLSLPRVTVAEKIEDDRENVRAFLALLHTLIMIMLTVMMMKGDCKHTVLMTMMRSVMVKCAPMRGMNRPETIKLSLRPKCRATSVQHIVMSVTVEKS